MKHHLVAAGCLGGLVAGLLVGWLGWLAGLAGLAGWLAGLVDWSFLSNPGAQTH